VFHIKSEAAEGVSECIILSQSTSIGTHTFKVVRRLMIDPRDLMTKKLLVEEAYEKMHRHTRKRPGRRQGFLRSPVSSGSGGFEVVVWVILY